MFCPSALCQTGQGRWLWCCLYTLCVHIFSPWAACGVRAACTEVPGTPTVCGTTPQITLQAVWGTLMDEYSHLRLWSLDHSSIIWPVIPEHWTHRVGSQIGLNSCSWKLKVFLVGYNIFSEVIMFLKKSTHGCHVCTCASNAIIIHHALHLS